MSKHDYVTLAQMIKTQRHKALLVTPEQSENADLVVSTRNQVIDNMILGLCDVLQSDNPRFDKFRFMQACEIDTESK